MTELQHPDTLHLQAALGWLELGNHIEADVELDKITPELRAHPDVLEARWQIYAAAKKWDAALDIASALVQLAPDCPFGWIHRSFCLHELKRTKRGPRQSAAGGREFPRRSDYALQLGLLLLPIG